MLMDNAKVMSFLAFNFGGPEAGKQKTQVSLYQEKGKTHTLGDTRRQ